MASASSHEATRPRGHEGPSQLQYLPGKSQVEVWQQGGQRTGETGAWIAGRFRQLGGTGMRVPQNDVSIELSDSPQDHLESVRAQR